MYFSSCFLTLPAYFVFLIPVALVYWLLSLRCAQNVFLLLASYVFYGWWDWRFPCTS